MDRLANVLARLPEFYNKEDVTSIIYNVIKSFVDECVVVTDDIDRLNNMIGIIDTRGEDLEYRWGNLLMIPRKENETDNAYRNRLQLSITSLSGGTANSIKYSIGVGLGINNDQTAMNRIIVYDAWAYPGSGVPTEYGNIVCTIDLNNIVFTTETQQIIIDAANAVKASGTQVTLVFSNYRILYYSTLDDIEYISLDNITYNQIGE